ncbi:bifunctional pyridoxal-dependent enzyme with beta-cystathionase and maltose regulon repressor activities [Chryseobacterium sp. H1D6B]|uniref:hypothetical protein n=1 Tax=Chryseobacterium sp. H1D6B TaxID=2940588 RepID=UPI0015CC4316|nr:hypothetical protein [Chryseobacterium sp. H1D6B]MDH6252142.1 bifunctional pyridoxal-dependent enzyme with beta-cystathionase and maltose regulon repressor activities [Chryseobacterium sp. H1D6B]
MNIDDAHSIWFDLPTLKKFVADIEAETQKIKPDATENDLGIRFHYAAYPRIENWDQMENQPIGQEYAGKHTLVMIPTLKMEKENGDYLHCDFNPLEASSYTKNDTTGRQSKVMAMGTLRPGPSSNTLAQNHGSLAPPGDPKAELF